MIHSPAVKAETVAFKLVTNVREPVPITNDVVDVRPV
jgi:hypothetical protein